MDGGETGAAQKAAADRADPAVGCAVQGRLPLVITVGFTGHRALQDAQAAAASIEAALAAVRQALRLLADGALPGADEPLSAAFEGEPRLRLLTGDAPGADGLAIERWRQAGLGEIHRLYPFRDPAGGGALTDRPERATDEVRRQPPLDGPWTGLDAVSLGLAGDEAHAEVAQWIVRHSQLLIALWDGEQMIKAGGAGDTLRKALERRLPAIWIRPGESRPLLVDPAAAHRRGDPPTSADRLVAISRELSADALAQLLRPLIAPPGAIRRHGRDPEVVGRQDYARVDPLKPWPQPLRVVQVVAAATIWKTYAWFETAVGGSDARRPTGSGAMPPASIAGQPGFETLRAACAEAAGRVRQLSAIHRSQQLLLIALATVAVFLGALPAVFRAEFPGGQGVAAASRAAVGKAIEGENRLHAATSFAELALGILAVGVAVLAGRYHRHRRWSDARRLAERLRAARASWPLGVDTADAQLGAPRGWTEWRAAAVLRAAGPRRGWLDAAAFSEAANWAISDLVEGQIAYHEREHHLSARLDTAILMTERAAFGLLMLMLFAFVLAFLVGLRLPPVVGGVVTILSAVCPAVGAACIAIEATSGFGELELRGERLAHEFRRLRDELNDDEGLTYHHVQDVIRRAAQLLVDESGAWRDEVARRRLVQ